MLKKSSSLRENLRLVYDIHGGIPTVLTSGYFWAAIVLAVASHRLATEDRWTDSAIAILPALAGFSIAAFAVIVAAIDPPTREKLKLPSDELGGKSPLMALVVSIVHAAIVQVISLLSALIISAKSIPNYLDVNPAAINLIISFVGLTLFYYAVMLVLAAILTTFRLFEILNK